MTRSLRGRLIVATALVLGGALGLFWGALYLSFSRALARDLDDRLAADAHALANLVELTREGAWEIDPPSLSAPRFEVWTPDGRTLARSPVFTTGLERLPRDGFADAVLPDGEPARRLQIALPPRVEAGGTSSARAVVVVLRGRRTLDSTLRTFRYWGAGLGAAVLALGLLATGLAVRRGLAPLDELAARIAGIDEDRLDHRLPEDVPLEMRPAVRKLNEALSRLQASFARERRFSADVSHELRTPLAALRAILEVSASREREAPAYRAALEEALRAMVPLQRLVDDLLTLARLEGGQAAVRAETVDLYALADECLRAHDAAARARGLGCFNRVPTGTTLVTDGEKLKRVLLNLVANAVQYTEEGGTVAVEADPAAGVVVDVFDSGPPIRESDLPRLFERFFRAEAARSGEGQNCGIGLSMARALCETIGLALSAGNDPDGGVRFRVSARAA